MIDIDPYPPSSETGSLGVRHLKRMWTRMTTRRRDVAGLYEDENLTDKLVIHALGLGLEQTFIHILQRRPSFEELEAWIVETAGAPAPELVARLNATLLGEPMPEATRHALAAIDAMEPVLSEEDLAFWEEHGYVILRDAVPEADRVAAERAIWEHLGARPEDPDTWYAPNDHGIMVQYFQHPAFDANRRSARIHKAFAQLWGTSDLWVTTDRVGFNAPERPDNMFRGPDLHWDVSLHRPIPFGLQGILYLTDTAPEQGAFTLVPGFHHRIDAWLDALAPGSDPRREDLHALGSMPVAGRAGDLIIWHHALPHGSRPNRTTVPRIVQYIAMFPTWREESSVWI